MERKHTTVEQIDIPESILDENINPFSFPLSSGHRKYQEDTVCVQPLLNLGSRGICPFAAVFDGHGGSGASELCRDTMPHHIIAEEAAHPEMRIPLIMSRALRQADAKFTHSARRTLDNSGSTAVMLCIDKHHGEAHYCWAGDSALWKHNVLTNETVLLTPPHKPDRPDERARIEGLGGTVIKPFGSTVFRVCGTLAVSRAVGDKNLQPMASRIVSWSLAI